MTETETETGTERNRQTEGRKVIINRRRYKYRNSTFLTQSLKPLEEKTAKNQNKKEKEGKNDTDK